MNDLPISTPASYTDFGALGRLKGEASRDPGKATRATAEQFEAYFLQQMMKAMRESVEKSDMVEHGNMDMYQDLMDKEVSLQMVRRGGMGMADMLEKQMLQQQALANAQAVAGLQQVQPAAPMVPLQPKATGMALPSKEAPPALPLERTGAFELQRRSGGQK